VIAQTEMREKDVRRQKKVIVVSQEPIGSDGRDGNRRPRGATLQSAGGDLALQGLGQASELLG
jgi:hypothetical protein